MLPFRQCCSLWHGLVFPFSAKVWKLKIENWNQFSIFFSAKTFKIVDRTTQGGGRGVHSHDNLLLLAPSPQIPFPPCEFFLPLPPSLPTHATLPWKGGSEKFLFTAQSLFKHERLRYWVHKGSCNNSKKNTLQGELIAKRKISRQERL